MTQLDTAEYKTQAKALLRLGGPLIVNNLAVAGMGFADAVMAGSLGARELAAVAVGGSFWFLGFTLCLGSSPGISGRKTMTRSADIHARGFIWQC